MPEALGKLREALPGVVAPGDAAGAQINVAVAVQLNPAGGAVGEAGAEVGGAVAAAS